MSIERGRVWSLAGSDVDSRLASVASGLSAADGLTIVSRRPAKRFRDIALPSSANHLWMTERDQPDSIDPSLELLHAECERTTSSGSGMIWIEGLGMLVHLHGFEPSLKFVRRLVDATRGTSWSIVLTIDPLTLEETELARIRREASPLSDAGPTERASRSRGAIVQGAGTTTQHHRATPAPSDVREVAQTPAIGSSDRSTRVEGPIQIPDGGGSGPDAGRTTTASESLGDSPPEMLSRLPPHALDDALLERRMEQWSEQGFDVSMVELALGLEGGMRAAAYAETEETVRRAVECLQRIHRLERPRFSTLVAKLRFRAYQLTGIDSIEEELDRLETAGHL